MALRLPDSPPPSSSPTLPTSRLRWYGRCLGVTRPMSTRGLMLLATLATLPSFENLLGARRRHRSAIHANPEDHFEIPLRELVAPPAPLVEPKLEPCRDVYALPGGHLVPAPKGAPLWQTSYRIPVQRPDSTAVFEAPSWSRQLVKRSEERKAKKAENERSGKRLADTKEEGWGDLEWMRDQSVLIIGDSLDRNGVFHLGTQLASAGFRHTFLTPETTRDHPLPKYPSTASHRIGVARHDSLNLTVANWFLMSIVASEPGKENEQESWFHPGEDMPQYFIPRLEQLYLPSITAGALPKPSVVVVYSALWDLAWSGYKRLAQHAPPIPAAGAPLDPEDVQRHQRRFVELVNWTKDKFPEARVVYRTVHETTEKADENVTSRQRIRQIAQGTKDLYDQGKLKVDDVMRWGERVKGREEEMEDGLVHFGAGSAQWLYHDMLLDQLRRHVLGPDASEWSECRDYRTLSLPSVRPRLGLKLRQDGARGRAGTVGPVRGRVREKVM